MKRSLHDFYDDLVHKHGWKHVAPLLDVVAAVETEIHKRQLSVFTSHEILRVSPHEAHADRMEDDILSIAPDRSGFARVVYQSKSDRQALPISEFLDRGGSQVSYEALVPTIIPHLERLAHNDVPNHGAAANGLSAVRSSVAGIRERTVRSTAAAEAVAELGRYVMKRLGFIGCWLLVALSVTGCVYALRPSNPTTRQMLQIQAPNPERYAVRAAEAQPHQVASDGHVSFEVPPLESGCAVYLCGLVKVADHRSEDVRTIQLLEDGQVVRRFSLNQISELPTGPEESHIVKLK